MMSRLEQYQAVARLLLDNKNMLYHHGNGGQLDARVEKLVHFMRVHCHCVEDASERITIEINKSIHDCPKPSTAQFAQRLGGISKTYSIFGKQPQPYHVWAVIRFEQEKDQPQKNQRPPQKTDVNHGRGL